MKEITLQVRVELASVKVMSDSSPYAREVDKDVLEHVWLGDIDILDQLSEDEREFLLG